MTPERDYAGWTKYIWLIYIIPFAGYPVLEKASAGRIALTWFATAVFTVIYLAGYRVSRNRVLLVFGAITLFGVAFMPSNLGAGAFFIFAASFAGSAGRVLRALPIIGIIPLGFLVDGPIIRPSPMFWWLGAVFPLVLGPGKPPFPPAGR